MTAHGSADSRELKFVAKLLKKVSELIFCDLASVEFIVNVIGWNVTELKALY